MLDDDSIKAVIFGRGGYGTVRMMDKINFNHFISHSKWLVGYSDICFLHNYVNQFYGIQTLHSTMPINFLTNTVDAIESLRRALATGCTRVNLGTAALEDPEWTARVIGEFGDRIAVGLDVRGHVLAARGWTKEGGDLFEILSRLDKDGCSRYVVTDVTKDGTLAGPNLELLKSVCAATSKPVVASGGISSLVDIQALCDLNSTGVEGAIVGKALYAGAFTLQEALKVTGR